MALVPIAGSLSDLTHSTLNPLDSVSARMASNPLIMMSVDLFLACRQNEYSSGVRMHSMNTSPLTKNRSTSATCSFCTDVIPSSGLAGGSFFFFVDPLILSTGTPNMSNALLMDCSDTGQFLIPRVWAMATGNDGNPIAARYSWASSACRFCSLVYFCWLPLTVDIEVLAADVT